jgi:hypothetical protein
MSQAGIISVASSIPPSVAIQYTTDNGIAVPAAGNLNVFGDVGTSTSGSGSTITIKVDDGGFDWEEKNADFAAAIQHGYFCNSTLTVSLPATASITIVYVDTTDTVTIQANTGQFIQFADSISTVGGTCNNLGVQGDNIELVFKPSDLTWHTINSVGTWTTT